MCFIFAVYVCCVCPGKNNYYCCSMAMKPGSSNLLSTRGVEGPSVTSHAGNSVCNYGDNIQVRPVARNSRKKMILVHQFNLQSPKSIFPSAKAKVRISDGKYLLPSPQCVLTEITGPCSLEEYAQRGRLAAGRGSPVPVPGAGSPRWKVLTRLLAPRSPCGSQEPRLQSKGSPPSACFCGGRGPGPGGTALRCFLSPRSFFSTTSLPAAAQEAAPWARRPGTERSAVRRP